MQTRLRKTGGGTSLLMRAGLFAVAAGAFLFLGWFVGDRFWKEGVWGVFWAFFLGLGIVGCITSRPTRMVFARAIVAFVIAVPAVFVLVLIAQFTLSLLHLTHFNANEFFLKSIVGAAAGVGCGIIYSMKATFDKSYWDRATRIDSRYSITELFQVEMLGLFPLAIGAALLMTVPTEPLARIILSVFWGLFSVVFAVVFTVLIDHEPATAAVLYLVFAVFMMIIVLIANIFQSMSGKHGFFHVQKIYEGLELAVPAAVTCIMVYLLVCLWSKIGKRQTVTNPAIPQAAQIEGAEMAVPTLRDLPKAEPFRDLPELDIDSESGKAARTSDSGKGGDPATDAMLDKPAGLAVTTDGGFLVADEANAVVYKVSADGVIARVAGTLSIAGNTKDAGAATDAKLGTPTGLAVTADGGFLIADRFNHLVRKVSADGVITRVAGATGPSGGDGEDGPAIDAKLGTPTGLAVTADGGFLIADSRHHVVRKVSAEGLITRVTGTFEIPGSDGDGGPATDAELNEPIGLAVTADGGFLIADSRNHAVRKVSADGVITRVAGTGSPGGSEEDGGPATEARLNQPFALAVTADGGFLIADSRNHVVRKVSADGVITRVAGTAGRPGWGWDRSPATDARLYGPMGLAVTADGGFLIADSYNHIVRKVSADGVITRVAGQLWAR